MSDDILMPTNSAWQSAVDVSEFELTADDVQHAFGVTSAKPLGRGTFGETWRISVGDGEYLAAKILLDTAYSQDRLDREVEGLTRVDSNHVVKLHETTTCTIGEATHSVLLFEYVPGGDVSKRLAPAVRVAHEDVAEFGLGLLDALAHLHASDTVHRDIKPANIALRDGRWSRPVVLDLGLARVLDHDSITAYPSLMGTAPFMAPEQLRQERARKAADIFAAGVVMHLLLSGEHPFYAAQAGAISLREAVHLISQGPAALPQDTPATLAALTRRLLAHDEADRGSARRARNDLAALLHHDS